MDIDPGVYVVAVSGGVDSMALLHMLQQQPQTRLIVAHLDHGIRPDSAEDRRLVQTYAAEAGLPFVYHEASLGEPASEATARQARYDFLEQVRQAAGARAIITAHHQDDLLETAVHNLLRGTGRRGLSSLRSQQPLLRPLLHLNKLDLKNYAQSNGLKWREDSTNADPKYRRNYIRQNLLPKLAGEPLEQLKSHIKRLHELNNEIDGLLAGHLASQPAADRLDRKQFIGLPHLVAREVMAQWLRQNGVRKFDRRLLERLVTASKTLKVGKFMSVDGQDSLSITKDEIALVGSGSPISV
jgi:tRNA(Ile)-lysidine synthase